MRYINWMASTPLSALRPYYPYRKHFGSFFVLLLIIAAIGFVWGVKIVLIIFPAIVILAFMLFRKNYSDLKRLIIFLSFAGLILTLVVEIVVLKGDIGRMNTVFKFYLQAWTLLALGSAYFLQDLVKQFSSKPIHEKVLKIWKTILILLLTSVLLFPITASIDKITDRISQGYPFNIRWYDLYEIFHLFRK